MAAFRRYARRQWIVFALRIVWAITILWFEYGTFIYTAGQCSWPTIPTAPQSAKASHILIVADPQILDQNSYPDRGFLLTFLSRIFTDLNLRRSWRAAWRKKPDAVVFLGDMMDNGRANMSDTEYELYYRRFNSIFVQDEAVPRYFVPGNHDTGIGLAEKISSKAHARYLEHFGPLNHVQRISDHTLLFVDAPGLVEEEYARTAQGVQFNQWKPVRGGPVEFIHEFSTNKTEGPVILFSHIPLARPEGMDCGPLRERGTIHRGGGLGYQNMLGKQMTHFILEQLAPSLIFSGDDHDYCEYMHTLDDSTRVREVTVKSLSLAMGIRRPGFQMLTLVPPTSLPDKRKGHSDEPCVMPDQLGIYLRIYVPLIFASVAVLLACRLARPDDAEQVLGQQRWGRRRRDSDDGDSLPRPGLVAKRRHGRFGLRAQSRLFDMFSVRRQSRSVSGSSWSSMAVTVLEVAVVPLTLFALLALFTCA